MERRGNQQIGRQRVCMLLYFQYKEGCWVYFWDPADVWSASNIYCTQKAKLNCIAKTKVLISYLQAKKQQQQQQIGSKRRDEGDDLVMTTWSARRFSSWFGVHVSRPTGIWFLGNGLEREISLQGTTKRLL